MDEDVHDFEQMQVFYQRVKHTWKLQDDATKREMLAGIRDIYHSLSAGERGFMTDIHQLERDIEKDLEGSEGAQH